MSEHEINRRIEYAEIQPDFLDQGDKSFFESFCCCCIRSDLRDTRLTTYQVRLHSSLLNSFVLDVPICRFQEAVDSEV